MITLSLSAFAEDGVTAEAILIGQSAGYTWQVASQVKEMTGAAKAYFEYVNKHGGVQSRKIVLISQDDGYDAKRAAQNAEKLITENKAFALALARGTPTSEAIVTVLVTQIVAYPWNLGTPLVKEFNQAVKESPELGVVTSYTAMEGYVYAKVLVEGLRRTGRNLTREGYIRALEGMRDYDLGGFTVSYGPDNHSGSNYIDITIIGKDGKFRR